MSNIEKSLPNSEKEYADVLHILKQHLCPASSDCRHGAVAFFKFTNEKAWAKVFPLDERIIDKYFPNEENIRRKVLGLINADRDYTQFYYYKLFREKHSTTEHFEFELTTKHEQLEHSLTEIEGKGWLEFVESVSEQHNILDQLFFKPNEKDYKVIPFPILYSPATLIVVPKSEVGEIDKIVAPVAESVHFYLFNRLLTELSNDVKLDRIGTNKQSLIQEFINQLVEVAIPIKYQIGNNDPKECFDWYGDWKIDSSAVIELTLAEEKVKLYMPTFCWHDGRMLHEKDEYRVRELQVKDTIENIFKLIYSNWNAINDTKRQGRFVLKQIVEDSGLNLHSLDFLGKEIDKIKGAVERAVNISDEDYAKKLGAVASKEVKLQKINEDGIEKGYRVIYGGTLIDESIYANRKGGKKDFGYDVLREIIEANGTSINVMDFSFFEEVRSVLPTKNQILADTQNGTKSDSSVVDDSESDEEIDNNNFSNFTLDSDDSYYSETINSTITVLKDLLKKVGITENTLKTMELSDFKHKVKNMEYIKEEVSKFKKSIDQLKHSDNKINVSEASKFINTLHKYFVTNIEGYENWHKNNGTTDIAKNSRFQKITNTVPNSRVSQRIAQNLSQLCNKLISNKEHGNVFRLNFEQAGLIYNESKRNFKYDKTKVNIANTLEWVFE